MKSIKFRIRNKIVSISVNLTLALILILGTILILPFNIIFRTTNRIEKLTLTMREEDWKELKKKFIKS